jgi:hypothetical protein
VRIPTGFSRFSNPAGPGQSGRSRRRLMTNADVRQKVHLCYCPHRYEPETACDAYWPGFREIDFLRALRSYAAPSPAYRHLPGWSLAPNTCRTWPGLEQTAWQGRSGFPFTERLLCQQSLRISVGCDGGEQIRSRVCRRRARPGPIGTGRAPATLYGAPVPATP